MMLFCSQKALILSISAIAPHICTTSIALVRGVSAFSRESGSRHRVSSMSAKTGTAPADITASMVATKVNGGTMTSSPTPTPQAAKATERAAVPLEQRWQ